MKWSNFVFALRNQAVIGGAEDRGFIILIPQGCLFANTTQGVQRIIEELNLPEIGWS